MKHIWIQRDLAIKHDNLAIKHVDCKHQTSYKIACQPGKELSLAVLYIFPLRKEIMHWLTGLLKREGRKRDPGTARDPLMLDSVDLIST